MSGVRANRVHTCTGPRASNITLAGRQCQAPRALYRRTRNANQLAEPLLSGDASSGTSASRVANRISKDV